MQFEKSRPIGPMSPKQSNANSAVFFSKSAAVIESISSTRKKYKCMISVLQLWTLSKIIQYNKFCFCTVLCVFGVLTDSKREMIINTFNSAQRRKLLIYDRGYWVIENNT